MVVRARRGGFVSEDDRLEELWERIGTRARVELTGDWRLDSHWRPFTAVLVVHEERAFVWRARAKLDKVVVRGHESFVDGVGTMDWRLFGRVPALQRSGLEIDRSLGERWLIESVWLREKLGGPLDDRPPGLDWSDNELWIDRFGAPDGNDVYGEHRYGGSVTSEGAWSLGWSAREPLLRYDAVSTLRQ